MALSSMPRISVVATAVDNIISQYQDSNLVDIITALLTPFVELETNNYAVEYERRLNNASGTQLDIIGDIVGASRDVKAIGVETDQFEVTTDSINYEDFKIKSDNNTSRDFYVNTTTSVAGTNVVSLSDEDFLRVIKAKILLNYCRPNRSNIKSIISILLDDDDSYIHFFDNYRAFYNFSSAGAEEFQVDAAEDEDSDGEPDLDSDGNVVTTGEETLLIRTSESGSLVNLNVNLSTDVAYGSFSDIELQDFRLKTVVSIDESDDDGVIFGSNISDSDNGGGYVEYALNDDDTNYWDIIVKCGDMGSVTAEKAITVGSECIIELSRVGSIITLTVNEEDLFSEDCTDETWVFNQLGKDASSDYTFRGVYHMLSIHSVDNFDNGYLYYKMNDQTNTFTPVWINSNTGYSDSSVDVSAYAITIENYDSTYWTDPELGYKIFIDKELTETEQSLLKANDLVPKPLGIPITWADANGSF